MPLCREGREGNCNGSSGNSGPSLSNPTEAQLALALFGGLVADYGHEVASVAVLTPYRYRPVKSGLPCIVATAAGTQRYTIAAQVGPPLFFRF